MTNDGIELANDAADVIKEVRLVAFYRFKGKENRRHGEKREKTGPRGKEEKVRKRETRVGKGKKRKITCENGSNETKKK